MLGFIYAGAILAIGFLLGRGRGIAGALGLL